MPAERFALCKSNKHLQANQSGRGSRLRKEMCFLKSLHEWHHINISLGMAVWHDVQLCAGKALCLRQRQWFIALIIDWAVVVDGVEDLPAVFSLLTATYCCYKSIACSENSFNMRCGREGVYVCLNLFHLFLSFSLWIKLIQNRSIRLLMGERIWCHVLAQL